MESSQENKSPLESDRLSTHPSHGERSRLLTLVFTDLVDSLGLKSRLGDTEASKRIASHYEGLRSILLEHGGTEIMATGDGSFTTFESPSQAVAFALMLQFHHDRTPNLPLVRIGIHMGEVTERHISALPGQSLQIEGIAVDLASRIQTLAEPGQILLSYPVFDNARQRLHTEQLGDKEHQVEWQAHGRYTFQGIDASLEIFEVGLLGISPFSPPLGNQKAHRDVRGDEESTLGWRPAQGQELPDRTNWVLSEKLGEGGFGDVWLIEHRKTKERRVVKFCYSTDRLRALKREVTLFRLLRESLGDRTDIARVLDYQFEKPPYFLEMEFAGHHNLTSWIQARGGMAKVPLEERLEIVAQVADAIAAAHSVGVLHKDIKPSNIMVTGSTNTSRPQIRMIDFGIGTVSDRNLLDQKGITATGLTEVESSSEGVSSLTGTRLFMAPELIEGKPATTKSDIYALGVVLYQLVSGRLDHSLSFGWERDIPDELLREDIQACVDGLPDNRLVSAEELSKRLRTLPERRKAKQKEMDDVLRQEHLKQRRRILIGISLLGFVLLLLIAQFAYFQKEKADTAHLAQLRAETARTQALKQAEQTRMALNEAQHAHYFGAIALAEASLRENRFDKAQEVLLNDAPEQFQQREWGWLLSQTAPEDMAIKRFDIFDTEFLPNGKYFVAGSRDGIGKGLVDVFDLTNGKRINRMQTNQRLVWNLAISPDGTKVATASSDNIVTVVDIETSAILTKIRSHRNIIRDVAFTPDGELLLTASRDKSIRIFNTRNFNPQGIIRQNEDSFTEISISPDSRHIVSGSLEGNIRVYDIRSATLIANLDSEGERALSVNYLKDNSGIAAACSDGVVRIFPDPATTDIVTTIPARISFRIKESYPSQVISAPDGKSVYVGYDNGTIRNIDTTSGTERFTLQCDQPLWKLALSKDGKKLLTTSRWSVRLLDLERLEGRQTVTDYNDYLSVPQEALPIQLNTVSPWRDQTWKQDAAWITSSGLHLVQNNKQQFFVTNAFRIFSPDRQWCIETDRANRTSRIINTKSSQTIMDFSHTELLTAAFSPNGKQAVVATTSEILCLRTSDWATSFTLPNPTARQASSVLYRGNSGEIVIGFGNGDIDVYDYKTGDCIRTMHDSGRSAVLSMDISGNRKLLAVGVDVDKAMVFDLDTGRLISTMTGHVRYVHGVSFVPGDERLVTLSRDGTVKMWDVITGRELVTLFSFPNGATPLGVAFSLNGRLIAAATSDKTVATTEVFPWSTDAYGNTPDSMEDRIEIWKRRMRLGANITEKDLASERD